MQSSHDVIKTCLQLVCTAFFNLLFINFGIAEGTKQLAPSSTDIVSLNINNPAYYNFARYGGSDDQRLYIHIADPENEQVFLGFSQPYGDDGHFTSDKLEAYFRIMSPNGDIVYGPQYLDGTTSNITTHAQCIAGPSNIAGVSGYTPFVFDPSGLAAGDYYIEFNAEEVTYSEDQFLFELFDITVATTDVTPVAKDGRVFSKNWAFFLPSIDQPSGTYSWYDRPFNGKLFVYTDEGFVSDIDFNGSGFQPAAFNIAVNISGVSATGDLIEDRKSLNQGQGGIVGYKIFLNDPDVVVYPSGAFGELLTDSIKLIGCVETGLYFKVATTKVGMIELLLDEDQTSGVGIYDPGTADRLLAIDVNQQITDLIPNLYVRYIPWDGLDGLNNSVNIANPVPVEVTFSQGVYHIPVYDAEYNLNGFTSNITRPSPPNSYTLNYYYNDSGIPDPSGISGQDNIEAEGCAPPCHRWSNSDYGDENTINTWWFAKQEFQTSGLTLVPDCGDDTDGDGVYDVLDIDWDNDGIPNYLETCTQPTNKTITVQVDIQLDFYSTQTTWDIKNAATTTVASGGPYPGQSNKLISDTLELEPGSYIFNIYDSNSDGMPTGYYQLTIDSDEVIGGAGNGSFGASASEALTLTIDYYKCLGNDPTVDSDYDGILNYKDDDFCTLNTFGVCETLDPDNDGIPSFLDLDSDNDGIPDIIEAGGQDINNDGQVAYATPGVSSTMLDSDDDGLADEYDPEYAGAIDNPESDGDNVHDAYDLDSDNDGIADLIEVGGVDTDGDGRVDEMTNVVTGDTNDNGWGDNTEASVLVNQQLSDLTIDFDNDTNPNHLDIDSDDDGITDVIESNGEDGNGDGMADDGTLAGTVTDANKDGWEDNYDGGEMTSTADGGDSNTIADFNNGSGEPDFDGDGQPNWLDIDADDDGILDNSEGQKTNSYVAPGSDSDNDGLNDAYEIAGTIGSFGGVGLNPTNTDGIADRPDYLDLDSDEDQEPDNIEGHDSDGDGIADNASNANTGVYVGTDADLDGLDDGYDNNIGSLDPTDGGLTPSSYIDFDDLISAERDWRETTDIDLDNDGIKNTDEDGDTGYSPVGDEDGDDVPNFQDDSDVTLGFPSFIDANNDGINDWYDTDIDGVPDFVDPDADNDGIPDIVEAGGIDTNGDGRADDLTDTDGDGLVDFYDSNCSIGSCTMATTGTDIPNEDTDGDGVMNYLDLDADNDGIPDLVEARGIDTNGDGRVDNTLDKDGDGFMDIYDENTSDGSGAGGTNGTALVDTDGAGLWLNGDSGSSLDTDGDNHVDGLDLDADNDGIPDIVEAGGSDDDGDGRVYTAASPWDADGDGLADVFDENASDGPYGAGTNGTALIKTSADTNNDGHLNASGEIRIGGGNNVVNADTDNEPNHLDIDADNDGIVDLIEAGGNDTDGNGLVDDFDAANPSTFDTADNDGWSPTYDGDAANDGAVTTTGDGNPMVISNDSNLDGIPESYSTGDADSDTHPDFLDIDADDDGIVDNVEAQTTAAYSLPDNTDTDGDGLDDAYDDYVGFGGLGIETNLADAEGTPYDHDTDGTPDYLDWDTDGDNIPDMQEAWDDLKDGDSQVDPAIGTCDGSDIDKDGLQDCFDSDTTSPLVTSYQTPVDDNGFNGGAVSASTPTSGNDPSEIFPDNSGGDGEPDWRDVLIDCSTPQVYYAITEKSVSTTSDYEYNGTTHIDQSDTKVVRATAFCEPDGDGWFYFYNPLEPENFLFALRNAVGSPNVVPIYELVDYIEVKVEPDPTNRHEIGATEANLIMERDWRVEFKGTPTVGSTFDIKFYYRAEEMATLKAAADEVESNVISGDATRSFYWFKKADGLENSDITSATVEGMDDLTNRDPNDVSDINPGVIDGNSGTTGNGRNYVSFEGLSSFSGGTAGIKLTYSVLPVELVRFTGKSENCQVALNWMTASEENFSHFEIERSEDGRNFEQIAKIEGQGNTATFAYSFTDSDARLTNYYRLKMIDLDGSFNYSNIEIVTIACEESNITIYPNPVKDQNFISLEFKNIQEEVSVSVFDVSGKMIKVVDYQANNDKTILDISNMPIGTYLVRFHYGGKIEAHKLVKLQ